MAESSSGKKLSERKCSNSTCDKTLAGSLPDLTRCPKCGSKQIRRCVNCSIELKSGVDALAHAKVCASHTLSATSPNAAGTSPPLVASARGQLQKPSSAERLQAELTDSPLGQPSTSEQSTQSTKTISAPSVTGIGLQEESADSAGDAPAPKIEKDTLTDPSTQTPTKETGEGKNCGALVTGEKKYDSLSDVDTDQKSGKGGGGGKNGGGIGGKSAVGGDDCCGKGDSGAGDERTTGKEAPTKVHIILLHSVLYCKSLATMNTHFHINLWVPFQ